MVMKRILSTLAFFIICLLLANCEQKKENDTIKVMFSWMAGPENAFLLYGKEKGFFEEEGLRLEFLPSKGSSIVATALANNEVQFGFISSDYALVSKSKNFPLTALLTLYHDSPVVIYSLEEKNIKNVKDLKNKKIGMLSKSAAGVQAKAFLEDQGLKENRDYKLVFSKGSVLELLNNHVDAMVQYTNYGPPEMEIKHSKRVNVIHLKDYGIQTYGTSIAVNDEFYKENPKIVEKFVRALLKSLESARYNHAAVLECLLRYDRNLDKNEMDAALAITEKMIYDEQVDNLGVGYMTYDGWERTLNYVNEISNQKIDKNILLKVYDDSFLKKNIKGK